MSQMNGSSELPPHWPAGLILSEIQALHRDVGEGRGEVRAGMRMLAENDRELFEQVRGLRDRMTRAEMRIVGPARQRTMSALVSFLQTLGPLMPAVGLVLYILAALGVAVDPTLVSALTGSD